MIKQRITKFNKMLIYMIAVSLVFIFIAGKDGFIRMFSFYRKISALEHNIKQLTKENTKLEKEIKLLITDDEFIEKIAREELGLIKSGEVVYKFIDE